MSKIEKDEKQLCLLELLNRTRLQLFTFEKGTMNKSYPNGAGSGFFFKYKDNIFLVTADHVCHPSDHKPNINQRAFEDKDVGIVNNFVVKDENGIETPILTPIGGFYYFDKINFTIAKGFDDFKPFDATFAILEKDCIKYPFNNEGFWVKDGLSVNAGLSMICIPSKTIVTPVSNDWYIVYGHTHFRMSTDGFHLTWDTTIHEGMRYLKDNGDYYVLTPAMPINDKDWEGISGAPVLNQEGGLLGILCGGISKRKEIYVMKMNVVIALMDSTLRIEDIEANSKKN